MAEPPPTRLQIDPPMHTWQVVPRNGRSQPVIATGHQPYLWHPGILAKDLAADAIAKHLGGSAIHVVVEHNALGPLSIDLPMKVKHGALGVRRLLLSGRRDVAELPPNVVPPLDPQAVALALNDDVVHEHGVSGTPMAIDRLSRAYASVGDQPHLAAQTSAVLAALKQPYLCQPMQTLPTSQLVTQSFVDRLLADPVGCVRCYNRAARAYPDAGIRALYVGRDVVEVPLWAQSGGACTPVYADLGDSAKPLLFTQDQAIDLAGPDALQYLRPRAITLSAIMRSELCDLFIHGTGGGIYDQVTERWWHDWTKEDLAPMALVSADVYLDFDAPLATAEQLHRAVWFEHHLRFNVDRYVDPADDEEAKLVGEKQTLLDRMDDDRDKRRRAKAFKRIHEINAKLRRTHHQMALKAGIAIGDARIGVNNAQIAKTRTWCFALYPDEKLRGLAEQISSRLAASPR